MTPTFGSFAGRRTASPGSDQKPKTKTAHTQLNCVNPDNAGRHGDTTSKDLIHKEKLALLGRKAVTKLTIVADRVVEGLHLQQIFTSWPL